MSDVNAPANQPIFDPPPIRGNRKVYTSINGGDEIDWAHNGLVNPTATEIGSPWPAPYKLTINTLHLTLGVASNVNLIVGTMVDGVIVQSSTLIAGNTIQPFTPALTLVSGAILQAILTAAPSGTGKNLGVIYRFTRAA